MRPCKYLVALFSTLFPIELQGFLQGFSPPRGPPPGPPAPSLIAVEDPGAFTTPWSATITDRRTLIQDWLEVVCDENKHEYYAVRDTAVPSADNFWVQRR